MRELIEKPNPKCLDCDNESINLDEYCENHQRCYYCGEREVCDNECIYQPLIEQYNRNREFKYHILSVNQIK